MMVVLRIWACESSCTPYRKQITVNNKQTNKQTSIMAKTVLQTQDLRVANPPGGIGYLGMRNGDIIDKMAQNRVWAWGLTPGTKIFVHKAYPVHVLYTTAASVLAAAHAVLLGSAIKDFAQGTAIAVASVVSNLSVATAQRAFGLRVTVFDSQLTYRPGWYHLAMSDGALAAIGSNLGEIYVRSQYAPFEVMMFAIQSAGGQASIVGMAAPTVSLIAADSATVAATATTTTVGVSAETLNERDLIH